MLCAPASRVLHTCIVCTYIHRYNSSNVNVKSWSWSFSAKFSIPHRKLGKLGETKEGLTPTTTRCLVLRWADKLEGKPEQNKKECGDHIIHKEISSREVVFGGRDEKSAK